MSIRRYLLLLSLGGAAPTLAQNAPRQLNTLPAVPNAPDTVRRQSPPQLSQQPQPQYPPAQAQPPRPAAVPAPVETTRFAVGLKNGTVYSAYDVDIKQPILGRAYVLLDDQRRIELTEISFYEDESGHYVRTKLPKARRETTLRRDRAGRLSLYSDTRTQYAGNGYSPYGRYGGYGYGGFGGFGGPMYRTVRTEYFSKDNGPIQDMTLRNLSLATADNAGSAALLMQARKYQTYSTLSYVAAAGVLAAGLFSSFGSSQSGVSISPLVYAGIPLAIVPLILGSKQQNNIRQAISLYNRDNQ